MNLFTKNLQTGLPSACRSTSDDITNTRRWSTVFMMALVGVFAFALSFSNHAHAQCDITVNWSTVSGTDFMDAFTWDLLDGDNNVALSGGPTLGQGASDSATLLSAANGPYSFQWGIAVNSFCDNFVTVEILVNGSPDLTIANTGGDGCGGYGGGPTALGGCAASGPPSGETCAEATPINAGSHTAGTIVGFGIIDACSLGGGTGARWYSWTAPSDGDVDLYACGAVDSRLSVFTGTCAALTCVADNDDANQAYPCQTGDFAAGTSFSATDGVTYLIQWDDRWSSAGFDWNLDFAPAADPGENCFNAISAVEGLQTAPAINSAAGGAALNCYPTGATGAVWYEWTAPGNGDVDVYSCGTLDTRLSIYDGSCAALNCVANNDDANQAYPCQTGNFAAGTSFEVTGGVTYYIEWDDRWSSLGFDWTLDFVLGATGDDCNDAVVAVEGANTVSGISATESAPNTCISGGDDAYWFEWTASGDGSVDVYSCGTIDTHVVIYDGSCAALNCVADNDDANQAYPCQTGNFAAGVSFPVSSGVTYYIEWNNDWSSAGFTWNLDYNADPGQCENGTAYLTASAPTDPIPFQIGTCTFQTEYNTINGIVAGETYTNNYTIGGTPNGYITVRSGTPGGPIVDEGFAPLTWTAVDAGTHYIHYNTNDVCGTATNCGVTTITCESCEFEGCTDDTALNYDPIATLDDGSCTYPPCVGAPESFDHCYGNFANDAFYFEPNTPGEEIAFVFTAGTVESSSFDNLTIYDGNSSSAPVLYTNGLGATALAGITVTSTLGNGLFMTITSDSSVSCGGGNYSPIEADIYCGTEGVVGCTDASACNYDASAGADDGSCFYECNDTPATAQLVSTSLLGTCNQISGDLLGAQTNAGGSATAFGNDLWYEFVAVSAGVRIETTTADVDLVLELQDAGGTTLMTEDITFSGQPEILNYGALTTGDTYRVRVASYGSSPASGDFNICIQHINGTECDSAPGSYSLCQLFKAKWAGAGSNNYVFTFTPTGGGSPIVYETNAAFTWAPLSNIPGLLWGEDYDVMINVEYTLTNGAGNPETILVENNLECPISINAAPTAVLRPADNLTNAGSLFLGAYIFAQPWACTANGWTWEFVNTDNSQLPIEFYKAGPARTVRLIDVPGLQPGATYDVRVKPEFPTSAPTVYGAVDQIAIVGSVGMETEIESPVVMAEDRVEASFEGAAIALYPNPNRGDYVNLNIANIEAGVDRVLVDIYDLAGKRVASEQIAVNESNSLNMVMPLNGIADGMYIVNIIINDVAHTERMMIQK